MTRFRRTTAERVIALALIGRLVEAKELLQTERAKLGVGGVGPELGVALGGVVANGLPDG